MTWDSIFEAVSHQSRFSLSKNSKTLFSFDEFQTYEGRFFIEIPHDVISLKDQRKYLKLANEKYREHHINVLNLYSKWFLVSNEIPLPIFQTKVYPQYSSKDKTIRWFFDSSSCKVSDFFPNQNLLSFDVIEDIDSMQEMALQLNGKVVTTEKKWHLVIDTNTQLGILNDCNSIKANQEISSAMEAIHNEELIEKNPKSLYDQFANLNMVVPSDSSQYKALEWYRNQKSFVLCGPPGTGKTQTILNLAFQAARDGKRVLIVSQKYSALEVLNQKVQDIGLHGSTLFLNALSEKLLLEKIENRYQNCLDFPQISQNPEKDEHLLKIFRHQHLILAEYYAAVFSKKENKISYEEIEKQLKAYPDKSIEPMNHVENSFLEIITPTIELQQIRVDELENKLHLLVEKINELVGIGLISTPSMNEFHRLKSKFDLVSQLSKNTVAFWFGTNSKLKRKFEQLNKKIENLNAKKQRAIDKKNQKVLTLDLYALGYLKQQLTKSNWMTRWFSSTFKATLSNVISQLPEWPVIDSAAKMQILDNSIQLQRMNQDIEDLDSQLKSLVEENHLKEAMPIIQYIENKMNFEHESWHLLIAHYGKGNLIEKDCFETVSNLLKWFEDQKIKVKDELPISLQSISMSQKEWQNRCEQPLRYSYNELLKLKEERIKEFPILKNYTFREMVSLLNKNKKLTNFIFEIHKQHLEAQLYQNFNQLYQSIISKYSKQSLWSKEEKDHLKNQLKWIEKKWSKRKFRHASRFIFEQVGSPLLSKLFPVIIATPELVSMQLPLEKEMFDYVLFDECSQMELMYSIPSLYRSKKVILVGDDQQLAPTQFFKKEEDSILTESLFSFGEAQLDRTTLHYHYRSAYRELISFSNTYFYNNDLKTTRKSNLKAIEYHYCPDGLYDQRANLVEAKLVVEKLQELRQARSKESIGIACFSIQQKQCIEKAIEWEKDKDPDFMEYIDLKEQEHRYLFVKNIETLQGDERDIMIVSIGYGRNQKGILYQFFGPILRHGGERRLNVLMSRARKKIIVITSLKSSDLKAESDNKGLQIFKSMLQWIENPSLIPHDLSKNNSYHNYLDYFYRLN